MKPVIVDLLARELDGKLDPSAIERLIEIPPSSEMGDFAFPCFSLSRLLRKSPVSIADDLLQALEGHDAFEKITAMSGYLNFFVNKALLARSVLAAAGTEGYGKQSLQQKIVVEFASPNTNKPLHQIGRAHV